jgi:cell division protein ZapA
MNALSPESVKVKIMDRDYVFACAPDEKESLMRCVALVDEKMNTIKNMGKLTQIDRIAVMAALTLARDCLTGTQAQTAADQSTVEKKITEITAKLDLALAPQEPLF